MRSLILTLVCICFLTTLVASANNYRYSTMYWETSNECTTCSVGETDTPVCIAFSGEVGVFGDTAPISDIDGNVLSFDMNDGNSVSTTAFVARKQLDSQQRTYTIYIFEFNYCYDYNDIADGFYVNSEICYRSPATNMAGNNRCSRIECSGSIDVESNTYQNSYRISSIAVPLVIPVGTSSYTIPYIASSNNAMPLQCTLQRNIDNSANGRLYPDTYSVASGINQYAITLDQNTCTLAFNAKPGNVFTVNVKLDGVTNAISLDFEVIVVAVESLAPQCQGTKIEGPTSITLNLDIADWDSPSFGVNPLVTPDNVVINTALPATFNSYVQIPIVFTIPTSGWENADTNGVLELRDSGGQVSQCTYSFPYRPRLDVTIVSDSMCPSGTGDTGCNGRSTNLTATVTGGTAPFTYIWSPFNSNASRVQAGVGENTLKVIDVEGKVGFASYTVVATTQLSLSCFQIRTCSGSGCVTAPNYMVCNIGANCGAVLYITANDARSIAGSGMGQQFQVDPGVYTPKLVNAAGCEVTVNAPITINARASLSVSAVITRSGIDVDIPCKGGSTTVTVTPSGGCPSYFISWTSTGAPVPASSTSVNGSPVVFNNIVAGTYTITVLDNASRTPQGCTQTTTITVTEPENGASTPSYSVIPTSCGPAVSCNGGNNGQISVTGTGSIVWTSKPAGQASVSGFNPTNLIAGTYAFQVTDNNGCQFTSGDISVTQPAALAFTKSVTALTCGNVQCKGSATGTITLTQTAGCSVASVQWSGPTATASTVVATDLLPGTYSYLITDVNGCTTSGSARVNDVPVALTATYSAINPGCSTGSLGSITVTPSGGCGTSTVTWLDNPTTATTRTGLSPGSYTYTVTDQNGCAVTNTVNLVSPSNPLAPSLSLQCGRLTATVSGGTGPFTYSWKTNGTVNAGITGATYTNAPVGANTVTVSDAGGCQATSPIQTIRFPFIETGLVDGTQFVTVSGTWTTTSTSAVLTSTGAGLSILRTNINALTTSTISGRFVTPSANTNNMVGLIVGYDTTNTYYYLLEWRGTVVTATCTGTGTQAASGLYLLRVPRTATECEIAKRQGGVTLLQQANIRTRWNAATTYNFVLAYTSNYILLDLNGVLAISYWFQSADSVLGVNPGYYGIVAGSQTGLKLENVATDAKHVSCENTDFTVQKRYTIDTGCAPSFSVSWGDGITDTIPSNTVTLDGSNSAQVSLSHDYASSGSFVGSFCMTTGAYTICDPFNILVAEYYVPLTNFFNGMTLTQNQNYPVTYQKSASTAISRPVKMELWNAANTQKVQDISSSTATTTQGVVNYRPTTSTTPAAYTLRLYWTQGEKKCQFYSSPVSMNIAA